MKKILSVFLALAMLLCALPVMADTSYTGTGKGFCTGEDLAANSENGGCLTVMEHGFGGMTKRVSSKPIICAVQGY